MTKKYYSYDYFLMILFSWAKWCLLLVIDHLKITQNYEISFLIDVKC